MAESCIGARYPIYLLSKRLILYYDEPCQDKNKFRKIYYFMQEYIINWRILTNMENINSILLKSIDSAKEGENFEGGVVFGIKESKK